MEVGSPNGIFEDVFIGTYKGTLVGCAAVYGDAMASEITHLFGVLGTPRVIQTGSCGVSTENILPGDIICATSAHCGEGASQYYLPNEKEIYASPELVDFVACTKEIPVAIHKGAIWTTSALLAEGKEDIKRWRSEGYIAVDMETATTFAVAKYFGMQRLSLLFVFDNPSLGDHILLTNNENQKRRISGEKYLFELVFYIIEKSESAIGS
ncbi:MAG: hypothetical protein AB1546_09010 [bacterium]